MGRNIHADSHGRLNYQTESPVAEESLPDHLDLIHTTAIAPDIDQMDRAIKDLHVYIGDLQAQEHVRVIRTKADLRGILEPKDGEPKQTGVILGMQHTPRDIAVSGSMDTRLRELFEAGIRFITPVYNQPEHPLGSGCLNKDGRLTELGRRFLDAAWGLGLIVDLSHVGHQTARDILAYQESQGYRGMVVATHGGLYSEHPHLRNLPDDVLRSIVAGQGFIGIYTRLPFLDKGGSTDSPFLKHLYAALRQFGPRHVTIGSDAVYRQLDEKQWSDPEDKLGLTFPGTPREYNDVGCMDRIGDRMRQCRSPKQTIGWVVGGTFTDFLERSLPEG